MSDERVTDSHPAFGMIGAYRTQVGPPGAAVFDSDIRHQHTVVVKIQRAERTRELARDWIHGRDELIEIEMSEAQWASFVSSMNTSGVPCTLRRIGNEQVERVDYAPRLEHSIDETRRAADEAFADIKEAFEEYQAQPTKGNLRTLQARIENATPNVVFAGKSLGEHAENVVQKARADIEAMVTAHAERLGIETGTVRLALPVARDE